MKSSNDLRTSLRAIDHKGYPAYKSLAGSYQFGSFALFIDHVQGDPFASPSSLHVEIAHKAAGFPEAYYKRDCSRIALQDFLTRRFASQFEDYQMRSGGLGTKRLPDNRYKDNCPVSCWVSCFWAYDQRRRAGKNFV